MKRADHVVYVVDDDPRVRDAIENLLSSCGYQVRGFGSAAEYLKGARAAVPSCLILDIRLPDSNGLDLQEQFSREQHPPIVFITGHGDIPSSVRAMKAGAVDFLPKPFSDEQILAALDSALERDRLARAAAAEISALRERYSSLTPREHEALPLIVSGLRNKQSAAVLGISLITFQIHRARIMRKMSARSLSDLVRMSEKLDIPIHQSATAAPTTAAPTTAHANRLQSKRRGRAEKRMATVAVVDDDPRVLESMENLLESDGYGVHMFTSGNALLDSGAVSWVDCIVCDISMPVMDGWEVELCILQERPTLPIIFITGHEDKRRQALSRAPAGRSRLIFKKPFDGRQLLAAIAAALARS
jgi:FixJ family two-component response regulator